MKKIVLTGGGTGGHVTPNIALIEDLKKEGYEIFYIGRKKSKNSKVPIEQELIENAKIPYYGISSGKLRRYLSKENLTDSFKVIKGVGDALSILKKIKPNIVFSKGGFVTAPVIIAAKLLRIPVVIHESDYTPGLANKISIPIAKCVCTSFEQTLTYLPKNKGIITGPPIRKELFLGNYNKGASIVNFNNNKPTILIMGGSTGANSINKTVISSLDTLLPSYNIIHICGAGNKTLTKKSGYKQFEYVKDELPHLLAYASLIVSRAGSNSIFELLALKKPNILIPLSSKVSRGDQILNSNEFEKKGYSIVLDEDNITEQIFVNTINKLNKNKDKYVNAMTNSGFTNGINSIIIQINKYAK